MKIYINLIFYIIFTCTSLYGHNSHIFYSYAQQSEMAYGTVFAVAQDNDGFIWYSSTQGVYKYCNNNVINIHNLLAETTQLPVIIRLHFDSNNNLWMLGNNHVLYCLTDSTNTIDRINIDECTHPIYDLRPAGNNSLLIAHANGIHKLNTTTLEKQTIFSQSTYAISSCKRRLSAFYTHDNCLVYEEARNIWSTPYKIENNTPKVVRYMYRISDNEVLLGYVDRGGLWKHNKQTKTSTQILSNVSIYNIEESVDNNEFWIATDEGIYIYNLYENKIQCIRTDSDNSLNLPDNNVRSIFKDAEGGIWIGSFFKGLCLHPRLAFPIDFVYPSKKKTHLQGNVIKDFTIDKYNQIWIATEDDGINKYNAENNLHHHIKRGTDANDLNATNTQCVHAVDNQLWIGTLDNGVEVIDIKSEQKIANYNIFTNQEFQSNFIRAIKSREKDIYIGSLSGLYKYNYTEDNFTLLHSGAITCLFLDNKARLWGGTYNHLFYMNENNDVTTFSYNHLDTTTIFSGPINHINADNEGNVWIATNYGLCKYTESTEKPFERLKFSGQYTSSNTVHRIEFDTSNNIWASTEFGLVCFNKTDGIANLWAKNSFLTYNKFHNSSFKDHLGQLYFGTLNGYIRLQPIQHRDTTDLRIQFSQISFKSNNNDTTFYSANKSKTVLAYHYNNIDLYFTALAYSSLNDIEYSYQLKGHDPLHTTTLSNNVISYQNLLPGNYSFVVQARNLSNGKISNILQTDFTIMPPIWQSIWAFVIYALTLFTCIVIFIRYKQHKLRQKHMQQMQHFQLLKEKEMYDIKMTFFTNIAHEIRTPLTLIKLPLEQLIRKTPSKNEDLQDLTMIQNITNRLIDLCSEMLKAKQNISNQLSFVKIDIAKEITDWVTPFKKQIEFQNIHFEADIPNSLIAAIDKEAFAKITSNLLNNAIKYCDKYIYLKLNHTAEHFIITVINDGDTINPEDRNKLFSLFFRANTSNKAQGFGVGLALIKQLIELHNGTIAMDITPSGMNRFTIEVPINQDIVFEPICHDNDSEYISEEDVTGEEFILIVEDDRQLREYTAKLLSEHYKIICAPNGVEALHLLNKKNIIAVVSDIMMDKMDGLTLCRTIKQSVEYSNIPVILLTAKEDAETRLEGITYGADEYITKPFSINHLLTCINQQIEQRKSLYEKMNEDSYIPTVQISDEQRFMDNFYNLVDNELSNTSLNMDYVADKLCVSRSTLYKKVKANIQISPNDYIRITRLKRAQTMLTVEQRLIKDVAFSVGFSSTTYFATAFLKQFGVSPTEYVKQFTNQKEHA
ncbi:MAG: hybrid sensor histidine kinase/response regulator transcription factor [Marinifilaceae bacterium]